MLNNKERKILVLAYNRGVRMDESRVIEIWRTKHHRKNMFGNLATMGLITPTESGSYIITAKGKELLGVEEDRKLEDFVKNENK